MPPARPQDIAVITFNDVPPHNPTFKYDVLGCMAIENHRRYCERHGYAFISDVPVARDRPACWAKIPALLQAIETHRWVLWADSDTLIFAADWPVHALCDDDYDLIVQSHDAFFRYIGVPLAEGRARMPINTGVFLLRSSAWSRAFLRRAYAQTQFVSDDAMWNGIGEQEAMIALLRQNPRDQERIKYVTGLQNHPRFYQPGDLFVHFYGNFAPHRISPGDCAEVIGRWQTALRHDLPFPPDRARFHWCCIQNKQADARLVRGNLAHYLYDAADLAPLPRVA